MTTIIFNGEVYSPTSDLAAARAEAERLRQQLATAGNHIEAMQEAHARQLTTAQRDIREWVMLAKRQQQVMPPSHPACPTNQAIAESLAIAPPKDIPDTPIDAMWKLVPVAELESERQRGDRLAARVADLETQLTAATPQQDTPAMPAEWLDDLCGAMFANAHFRDCTRWGQREVRVAAAWAWSRVCEATAPLRDEIARLLCAVGALQDEQGKLRATIERLTAELATARSLPSQLRGVREAVKKCMAVGDIGTNGDVWQPRSPDGLSYGGYTDVDAARLLGEEERP